MTIREALKKYFDVEADLLLAHIFNKPKEFLYLHPEKKLTEPKRKQFIWLANQRRHGVPMAYLLGYKYFYGLKFKVNNQVLIPRPETEWLVDQALKYKTKRILDVGTGSGCIAVSVAKQTKAQIFASDISAAALKVARDNAKLNKVKVNFIKSNLLENVSGKFDLIIANLPYVPLKDYKSLKGNLKYEPKSAITDKAQGTKLIEKLLTQSQSKLNSEGTILLEIDPSTKTYLQKWIKKNMPLQTARFYKDIRRLYRYCVIGHGLR